MSNKTRSTCLAVLLCAVLTGADQLTKYLTLRFLKEGSDIVLIPGILRLTYVENRGAAFGILQGKLPFFLILTALILVCFAYCYRKLIGKRRYFLLRMLCCIVCAGAAGNLIDRLRLGYVVDMICFEWISFPVFNIADCYITVSAFVFTAAILFYYKEDDFSFLVPGRKKSRPSEAAQIPRDH